MQTLSQDATRIKQNAMVLELVQLVYELLRSGFYKAPELRRLMSPMLRLLDGREDVTGLEGEEEAGARYGKVATIRCNTVLLMESKRVLCEVFQLICTIRLDIRLSMLLGTRRPVGAGRGSDAPS